MRKLARSIVSFIQRPTRSQVLIASYPKSGSTWLRQIVFSLIHGSLPNDMETFDKLAPELGKTVNIWRSKIVKTHWAYSKFFDKAKRIYIVRPPIEVFRSYYDYQVQVIGKEYGGFEEFFHSRYGVANYLYNLSSWCKDNGKLLINYDDLLSDFDGTLKRISDYLEIEIDEERLQSIRLQTSRSSMQKRFQASGFQYDFANYKKTERYALSALDKSLILKEAQPAYDQFISEHA